MYIESGSERRRDTERQRQRERQTEKECETEGETDTDRQIKSARAKTSGRQQSTDTVIWTKKNTQKESPQVVNKAWQSGRWCIKQNECSCSFQSLQETLKKVLCVYDLCHNITIKYKGVGWGGGRVQTVLYVHLQNKGDITFNQSLRWKVNGP